MSKAVHVRRCRTCTLPIDHVGDVLCAVCGQITHAPVAAAAAKPRVSKSRASSLFDSVMAAGESSANEEHKCRKARSAKAVGATASAGGYGLMSMSPRRQKQSAIVEGWLFIDADGMLAGERGLHRRWCVLVQVDSSTRFGSPRAAASPRAEGPVKPASPLVQS